VVPKKKKGKKKKKAATNVADSSLVEQKSPE